MIRFRLLLLVLPACAARTALSLDRPAVRAQLSERVYATLRLQHHYFGSEQESRAFAAHLREIARATTDAQSYYRGVADSLAALREGHTGLVGSAEVPFSSTIPPVAILEVEDQPVIAGVAPGVEGGGLRPGDLVLEVDGLSAVKVLERQFRITAGSTLHGRRARAAANLLAGPTNTPATVRVRGLDGHERICYPLRFLLDDEGEDRFRFGFLPRELRAMRITAAAGYVSLPDFQEERFEELERQLASLTGLPVLVLDLRGNPGGRIKTLQQIAGIFVGRPTPLLQLHEGDRDEPVEAEPGPTRYRGELKILVDERTGSAAELLAAAMQDLGRAKLYGRATAGSTRSRHSVILPGGVVFHYAGTTEFRRRDGRPIEGVGVKPDVIVLRSREELARGAYGAPARDPTVRLALGLN